MRLWLQYWHDGNLIAICVSNEYPMKIVVRHFETTFFVCSIWVMAMQRWLNGKKCSHRKRTIRWFELWIERRRMVNGISKCMFAEDEKPKHSNHFSMQRYTNSLGWESLLWVCVCVVQAMMIYSPLPRSTSQSNVSFLFSFIFSHQFGVFFLVKRKFVKKYHFDRLQLVLSVFLSFHSSLPLILLFL